MNRVERLLCSPLGAVLARPWFDVFVLGFFTHRFFPLSRLWAAAREANGSAERFFEAVPMPASTRLASRLENTLCKFEQRRSEALAAEAQWETAFFGVKPADNDTLAAVETKRLARRAQYNAMRKHFAFVQRGRSIPPVRWEPASPAAIATDYAKIVMAPDKPFDQPQVMPAVEVSHSFGTPQGRHYWLRFTSPGTSPADTVTARVLEPLQATGAPTVIFFHGICVEFDHWHGMIDDVAELSRLGIRTIRIEAPWHGRRVAEGRYGGEKFIGSMPFGALDFFAAQVREAAVLMDWCRSYTDGPVAIGGSSLGAHVARLIATRAARWQPQLQPDALLLITPCEKLEDAAINGAFADVWKTVENSATYGWTADLRAKWFGLIDPAENPCVSPSHIVAILGSHDRVTPFPSGMRLVERMKLPGTNIFVRRQGHFSTPLNLVRDKTPLYRFRDILSRLNDRHYANTGPVEQAAPGISQPMHRVGG
jgi:pimeloyl-ACP methyl ester carboxylesterase